MTNNLFGLNTRCEKVSLCEAIRRDSLYIIRYNWLNHLFFFSYSSRSTLRMTLFDAVRGS